MSLCVYFDRRVFECDVPAYAKHLQKFLDLIPEDRSPVDLQPLTRRLALDASIEFLFGESVRCLEPNVTSSDT